MGLTVLDGFPAEVVEVDEKFGCQRCPLMQEYPYGETFEPECTANTLIRIPSIGTPPECPLRKKDVVVTLNTGR